MTPGCQAAPGVFSSVRREQTDRRHVAFIPDWCVRGGWNAGKIRAAGAGAGEDGEHLSLWHAADQPDWMYLSWIVRANSAEQRDSAAGMAHGHRRRICRRVYHVFELRVGNGEDAGGGGVAVGDGLR